MTSGQIDPEPRPEPRPDRPRIFGIGLNKTATTSLDAALTLLGYVSLHDGGLEVQAAVQQAIADEAPLLSNLDPRYDAFSDIGVLSRRFAMLDRQYPGSSFVFTTRPFEDWIDSRRRHVERNVANAAIGEYDGTFLVIDVEKWTREWEHHVERVHAYFDGRADFLEIDLTKTPEWGPLCRLLGVVEPEAPFPWANRDRAIRPSDADAQ